MKKYVSKDFSQSNFRGLYKLIRLFFGNKSQIVAIKQQNIEYVSKKRQNTCDTAFNWWIIYLTS